MTCPCKTIVGQMEKRVQSSLNLSYMLDDSRAGEQVTVRVMRRSGDVYAALDLPLTFGSR